MELVEANGIEDFKFLYELETDPEIIYYYHPNFSEDGKMEFLSYDKAMKEYENQKGKKIYLVSQLKLLNCNQKVAQPEQFMGHYKLVL